jgi:hypothetical protein
MSFRFDNYAYYNRYIVLYTLIGCVVLCLIQAWLGLVGDASKWLNSAGLVLDLTGIVQLEISGFFETIANAAMEHHERTGLVPSRFAREIVDTPEEFQTTLGRFEEWLKRSPKAGVVFFALGCLLQLIATWMP